MLLNILNETTALPTETLPQLDVFGALAVGIIGLIIIFVVIRYFIKRNKE